MLKKYCYFHCQKKIQLKYVKQYLWSERVVFEIRTFKLSKKHYKFNIFFKVMMSDKYRTLKATIKLLTTNERKQTV